MQITHHILCNSVIHVYSLYSWLWKLTVIIFAGSTPPVITQCVGPNIEKILNTYADSEEIVMSTTYTRNVHYLVTGNIKSTVFDPPSLYINASVINTALNVLLTVTDQNDNTDSCNFQYNVVGESYVLMLKQFWRIYFAH